MNILPFGSIHKNKIIGSIQLSKDLGGIPGKQADLGFPSCLSEILPGNGNPFLIILNGGDLQVRRAVFTHQKCGKAHCSAHLQDGLRAGSCKEHFKEALHLLADDGNTV